MSDSEPPSAPRMRLREETASPQVRRLAIASLQRCCLKARCLLAVAQSTVCCPCSYNTFYRESTYVCGALAGPAPTYCCATRRARRHEVV